LDLQKEAEQNYLENVSYVKGTIIGAEAAVDLICQKGGEILYDKYLRPKVRPRALENTKICISEICNQVYWPGDLGERDLVAGGKFKEDEW
jgi:hypothetical protein